MTVEATTTIAASPEKVWDFLLAPESAFLCGDGVLKAFRVPGTPAASIGEQHCTVAEHGGQVFAHIVEVIELQTLKLVVTRTLTSPAGLVARYCLEEAPSGFTSLTYHFDGCAAFGTRKKAEPPILAHVETAVRRIKASVESGAIFYA